MFIGINQCGDCFRIRKYPRKELLEQLGYKHADKMYRDTKNKKSVHIGYVIGQHWIEVFKLSNWKEV